MAKNFTLPQVIELLKKRQGDRPASKLAQELGISKSYLSEIFQGKREPGPSVLAKIGFERVVLYQAVKIITLMIVLGFCAVTARAGDSPQKSDVSCVRADLGLKASMAGFHLDRCISTVDGKLSLLTVDLKRVMANGNLYPGSTVRHMEFANLKAYEETTCVESEKHDIDRLWKSSECKWVKDQQQQ